MSEFDQRASWISRRAQRSPLGWQSATALAALCALMSSVPVFFVGAAAVQVQADLSFGHRELGMVVAAYFAASALSSRVLGPAGDRYPASLTVSASLLLTSFSCVGIGAVAHSWQLVCLFIVVAGVGNGIATPALASVVLNGVPDAHHGLSFGSVQAAVALATSLGGLAVPLVVLTLGWRELFVGASLAIVGVGMIMCARAGRMPVRSAGLADGGSTASPAALRHLAVGFGLGMAVSTGLIAFAVDAAVEAGLAEGTAGVVVAVASGGAVAVRVLSGWLVDLGVVDHLRLVAVLLAAGAIGLGFLAVGEQWSTYVGLGLALTLGWGWVGLVTYAVADMNRSRPAAASGAAQSAAATGGVLGPLLFGVLVPLTSYRTAWLVAATVALMATRRIVQARGADRGVA